MAKAPRSDKYISFVGTIGALANWTIPIAALTAAASNKDPSTINTGLTAVLIMYSGLFLRWSIAIKPANYPLFACHAANIFAQSWQLYRGLDYKKKKEKSTSQEAKV